MADALKRSARGRAEPLMAPEGTGRVQIVGSFLKTLVNAAG